MVLLWIEEILHRLGPWMVETLYNGINGPQVIHFKWDFLYKPSILGYLHDYGNPQIVYHFVQGAVGVKNSNPKPETIFGLGLEAASVGQVVHGLPQRRLETAAW